jgi:hypothetical protein
MNNSTILNTGNMSTHPQSFDAYIAHGWKLTMLGQRSKKPVNPFWQHPGNHIQSVSEISHGCGVAILHAYSGTCSLDFDDVEIARQELKERGIDYDEFINRPGYVQIISGRKNKMKLLFKAPPGFSNRTKQLVKHLESNARKCYLEMRFQTKDGYASPDTLPPSIHPKTHMPYEWGGTGHWSKLPELPEEIKQWWDELCFEDVNRKSAYIGDVSWQEVVRATTFCEPDCSYDEWAQIGMAIHDAAERIENHDAGLKLFDLWSSGTPERYPGFGMVERQYKAFSPGKGITLATLFHEAAKNGFKPQEVDLSELFGPSTKLVEPIDIFQPTNPHMDWNLLPEMFRDYCLEFGELYGTDSMIGMVAIMSAVSGFVDCRTRLHIKQDFEVPPIYWSMVIAVSGSKKTKAFEEITKILRQLEKEDRPNYKDRMRKWELINQQSAMRRKSNLEVMQTIEKLEKDPLPICENKKYKIPTEIEVPPLPLKKELVVGDITSQKLVRMCVDRPEGLVCAMDELYGFFKSITDTRSIENRSTWVCAYEGNSYKMHRVGDGDLSVDHFAVGIFGNVQPHILDRYINELGDDGFLQRFFPVQIDDNDAKVGKNIPLVLSKRPLLYDHLKYIHTLPHRNYTLSNEAYAEYEKYEYWVLEYRQLQINVGAHPLYLGFVGKLTGLAGRTALIWHLLSKPEEPEIGVDLMRQVITFMKTYYLTSVRNILGVYQNFKPDSLEKHVADVIIHHCHEDDIRRSALAAAIKPFAKKRRVGGDKNRAIQDCIDFFENLNWLKPVDEPGRGQRLAIHPKLRTMYAERKAMIAKVKAIAYNSIVKNGELRRQQKLLDQESEQSEQLHEPSSWCS